MAFLIFFIGIFIGYINIVIINYICFRRGMGAALDKTYIKLLVIIIYSGLLTVSFFRLGLNVVFLEAAVMDCILIIISVIDIKFRLIPDKLVAILLLVGSAALGIGKISPVEAMGGMAAGGGILFILALIPGAMGGGDVKLMFALGLLLGFRKSMTAVMLAFIISAFIGLFLLIFRIRERKDHIPFGPFLALGSFISFHFFN